MKPMSISLKHQSKGYSHANRPSFFLSKYDQSMFALSLLGISSGSKWKTSLSRQAFGMPHLKEASQYQ